MTAPTGQLSTPAAALFGAVCVLWIFEAPLVLAQDEGPSEADHPLPTVPEYLLALSKDLKPRWRTLYEPAPLPTRPDRPRAAVLLGSLLADTFVAVEARDSQRIRNLTQDLRVTFRSLGLGEAAERRLQRIGVFADAENWDAIRFELEAGQAEARHFFAKLEDHDLAHLAATALWLRALEIGARVVVDAGDPAKLGDHSIGSHDLVRGIRARLDQLSPASRRIPIANDFRATLDQLEDLWSDPDRIPSQQEIADTQKLLRASTRNAIKRPE